MMKKIVCCAFALLLICLSLTACSSRSGGYKLVDMPDGLSIDAKALPDEIDTDADEYFEKDFPLVASIESEDFYIYDVHGDVNTGVLIKYKKVIQYFSWSYRVGTSKPEVYAADYDGDGEKEIAVALLADEGITNHNENLYIVKYSAGKLSFAFYSSESFKAEIKAAVSYKQDEKIESIYTVFAGTDKKTLEVENGRKLIGIYSDAVQDFELGDKIYCISDIGFVYEDSGTPEYNDTKTKSEIVYYGTYCTSIKCAFDK